MYNFEWGIAEKWSQVYKIRGSLSLSWINTKYRQSIDSFYEKYGDVEWKSERNGKAFCWLHSNIYNYERQTLKLLGLVVYPGQAVLLNFSNWFRRAHICIAFKVIGLLAVRWSGSTNGGREWRWLYQLTLFVSDLIIPVDASSRLRASDIDQYCSGRQNDFIELVHIFVIETFLVISTRRIHCERRIIKNVKVLPIIGIVLSRHHWRNGHVNCFARDLSISTLRSLCFYSWGNLAALVSRSSWHSRNRSVQRMWEVERKRDSAAYCTRKPRSPLAAFGLWEADVDKLVAIPLGVFARMWNDLT